MENMEKIKNEKNEEKLWSFFEKYYSRVFDNLGGVHDDNDLIANTLIKDRLSKITELTNMSVYQVQEIIFFYRMVRKFDYDNLELFQRFSEIYMKDVREGFLEYKNVNNLETYQCLELGIY